MKDKMYLPERDGLLTNPKLSAGQIAKAKAARAAAQAAAKKNGAPPMLGKPYSKPMNPGMTKPITKSTGRSSGGILGKGGKLVNPTYNTY